MGDHALSLRKAWGVYARWLEAPRVEFSPEPRGIYATFGQTIEPFEPNKPQSGSETVIFWPTQKDSQAVLVTFEMALQAQARKQGHAAVIAA